MPAKPTSNLSADGTANGEMVSELAVAGMTCNNCARHVREAVQGAPGVAEATVNLAAGRAKVRWVGAPNMAAVIQAITAAGYEATPLAAGAAPAPASSWSPLSGWRFNVVAGLVCTLPLMIGEWVFQIDRQDWFRWLAFALASFAQIFCGARFYLGAWRQLKTGGSNMDTLVALGSTTAFGYSAWALFSGAPGHLYFMESAAIITLISIGHWVEARTSVKAESSLQALLRLAPPQAKRRNPDGTETDVAVPELRVNDLVVLKPGDHIPVDGEVTNGGSSVDEAMLTGESIPTEKKPGDTLYAGTVNLNGQMLVRVTATGEATALAHIIAAVTRAQGSRAKIQRLGDRVSNVFVPVVVLIALATGLFWGLAPGPAGRVSAWLGNYLWFHALPASVLAGAFIHAAAVLIIVCPCAMGLATPVAIMAGANAAARRGILIRDGIALEQAGELTTLIFDKTGTLTGGKPAVARQEIFVTDTAPWPVMQLAAALGRRSNHPLSQSVARLHADDCALTDWREIRGAGVEGRWQPENSPTAPALLRLGSLRWLKECGVDLNPARKFETSWAAEGGTLLGIAAEHNLLGILAVKDLLKPGARAVVQTLQASGLKILLVTGDNPQTAQAIAKQAGIASENIFAEFRPEQKARLIQDLQKRGERVAFVGDGINDAPALEAADLGIAVSRASDVAREAADIILLKSEIQAVPEALGLARATLRTIKQNLFWAFFYNVAGIPLAALGLMSPVLCALAMGLSDLVVIGNALRLLRWKLPAGR